MDARLKSTSQSNGRPHEIHFEVIETKNMLGVKDDEQIGFLIGDPHSCAYVISAS